MVDRIHITKITNGYTVSTEWDFKAGTEGQTLHFKTMDDLIKHLDDCFVKPFKDISVT